MLPLGIMVGQSWIMVGRSWNMVGNSWRLMLLCLPFLLVPAASSLACQFPSNAAAPCLKLAQHTDALLP